MNCVVEVGSSGIRGSWVYVGVNIKSGELVTISEWLLPLSTEHDTESQCQVELQTQVLYRSSSVLIITNKLTVVQQITGEICQSSAKIFGCLPRELGQ